MCDGNYAKDPTFAASHRARCLHSRSDNLEAHAKSTFEQDRTYRSPHANEIVQE
jgi:hypothetical protein